MIYQVNKKAIAASFGRAARHYTRYDELHRRSVQGLLDLLETRCFTKVLDAGCGPGSNSLFWRKSGSKVIALDLSPDMLVQARKRKAANSYLVADIEALPLLEAQFDLAWSHLAVQWCSSLSRALASLYRVTQPGGKIAFTTLLFDSLHELKIAWYSIDKKSHVNLFLTKEEIEVILSSWNYRSYIQTVTLHFNDAQSAMRSIKGIGANHLNSGRTQQQYLTRRQLQYLEFSWPRESKYYPLTYQLFHGVIDRD